jgi:hypothetical protein
MTDAILNSILISVTKVMRQVVSQLDPPFVQKVPSFLSLSFLSYTYHLYSAFHLDLTEERYRYLMSCSSMEDTAYTPATKLDLESKPDAVSGDRVPHDATDQEPQQVAHQFLEGGSKAWLVVLGCWCTSFASFGYVNSFGLVLDETSHVYDD